MEQGNTSLEVSDAAQLLTLMKALCRSSETCLCFEQDTGAAWPVALRDPVAGEALHLDLNTAPQIAPRLRSGEAFRLTGQTQGALLHTAPLRAQERGDLQFACDYPTSATMTHRRSTFRAELYRGMQAEVELLASGGDYRQPIRGTLRNLSLGGCLLEVPLAAAVQLKNERNKARLTARFPSGRRFRAEGHIRHVRSNDEWTKGLLGYEFVSEAPDFERLVWYFVKEIERQGAHRANSGSYALIPSELFPPNGHVPSKKAPEKTRLRGYGEADLGAVADFLNAQTLGLQAGAAIAVEPLLQHSETLLDLLRADREALLYATACLGGEPVVVQHGLSVAVRLADLGEARFKPDALRAIVACALVHDLGKALLPDALLSTPGVLAPAQMEALYAHVAQLSARLGGACPLPAAIVSAVIGWGNERLDGSGYPEHPDSVQLPELARMMAIVDVADAMRRPRPDRPAWPLAEVYRHLLRGDGQFDNEWVQRYIRRFGMTPIGSLARYAGGALGWIQRLDAQGQPAQIQLVMHLGHRRQRLDQTLYADDLPRLGPLEGTAEAGDFGL